MGIVGSDGKQVLAIGAALASTTGKANNGFARAIKSPFEACGGVSYYCTPNNHSGGQAAAIQVIGTPSLSGPGLILQSSQLPTQGIGLFFYGDDQVNIPLSNGIRCVGTSIVRLTPQPIMAGQSGGFVANPVFMDVNFAITSPGTKYFQFWFRDQQAGDGESNLSQAVQISFCP